MLVRELIDRLEASGLLDEEILDTLRQQLEESGARATPEAVVKLLVDNGHLTRFQATKLIGDLRSADPDQTTGPAAKETSATNNEDELLLVTEDLDGLDEEEAEAVIVVDEDGVAEAVIIDDEEPAELAEVVTDAIIVESTPVEVEPAVPQGGLADLAPHPVVPTSSKKPKPDKNVWDSVWIYGVAGIIVLLLGVGGGIVYVLTRTSADEFVEKGNSAYESGNFSAARDVYTDFVEAYPADKSVSLAKVRIGISSIVLAKNSVGDAATGLKKAKEILPTIENEPDFEQDRENVANLLVDIGTELAEEADAMAVADDKAVTLSQLDEWFELLENPLYMTSTLRQNFGPRITAIEETRARVVRDIARDRDTVAAISEMRTAIEGKDTKKSYDIRKELVRKYPRLTEHPEINALILEASGIQKDLVSSASSLPSVTLDEVETEKTRAVMLNTLIGQPIPELANRVIYFKARGTVMAMDAETGNVRWRRYVGYTNDNPPVSLGDAATDGVLLSDGREGELQRISDNQIQWRSQLGEPFHSPVVDSRTIYVTTSGGNVFALDGATGDARWGRTIPQPCPVPPGHQSGTRLLYVVGEHSNLYILDSTNGKCLNSYYLGHESGTINVAPVSLLGHLFVFENAGTDYCIVHILKINEEDGSLSVAQKTQRLTGNVRTPPEVRNQRMIVLTDLGQIVVMDVEPSAENDKVSIAAQQVATYDRPTDAKMVVGRNELWVSGARIARYDLQINTGKVVPDWVKYEGDNFISKPILSEGVLIHARQLRGTRGVRVIASRPSDGTILWQNDVGVPISMLAADSASRSIYAVTTQAALYQLDEQSLMGGGTVQPIENPGGDGVAMRFANPLNAGEGRRVILNQESAQQLVVFDPNRSREKLRLVTLSIPQGTTASAPSILMAGGLLMPMDNGRVMLMNWESGAGLGSPFQPPTKPGEKVVWTTPVPNPSDAEQVLIANDSQMLFRLRVGEQIRELSKGSLAKPVLPPTTALNGNWFAVVSGETGDTLVTYSIASLEEISQRTLGNRVVFGPISIGSFGLLQTADGKLQRIDETGNSVWSIDLPSGQPVASPLVTDGTLLITGADGWILSVAADSGEVLGRIDVGQPLSGNPLIAGSQMLVPGSEGIVFIVAKP